MKMRRARGKWPMSSIYKECSSLWATILIKKLFITFLTLVLNDSFPNYIKEKGNGEHLWRPLKMNEM